MGRNGQLRENDVNNMLETTARTKVARYREAYAHRAGLTVGFITIPRCEMRESEM